MQLIVTVSSGNTLNNRKESRHERQNDGNRNTGPDQTSRENVPPTAGWLAIPNAADAEQYRCPKDAIAYSVQPEWQVAVVNHVRLSGQRKADRLAGSSDR